MAEEWEIWDKEEEVKKLVSEKFHEWIKIFGKKQSERMLTKKIWDHAIDTLLIRWRNSCQGKRRYIHYQEKRERK